eukprot:jgi/Ulvmu1/5947/UM026_0069.1
MRISIPVSIARRTPAALSRALSPKTVWGMTMVKAVASLQDGNLLTYEPIKLKGVTFSNDETGESRQDILDRLRKSAPSSSATGLPVLLMREPDNPADPKAVTVMSSLGQIGYVPRESTHLLQHACTPGYTDWIWQPVDVPDAMLGCSIVAAPALRASFIQVTPPQLAPYVDVKRWLPAAVWEALEEECEESSLGCCQVTGIAALPMHPDQADSPQLEARVFPIWRLELHTRVLKLTGFQVLCAPVLCALALLDLEAAAAPLPGEAGGGAAQRGTPQLPREGEGVLEGLLRELAAAHGGREVALDIARTAAVDALRCCNAWYVASGAEELQAQRMWREEDVKGYVEGCWAARERCLGQEIGLDVSWLVDEGFAAWVDIPDAVRRMQPAATDAESLPETA